MTEKKLPGGFSMMLKAMGINPDEIIGKINEAGENFKQIIVAVETRFNAVETRLNLIEEKIDLLLQHSDIKMPDKSLPAIPPGRSNGVTHV